MPTAKYFNRIPPFPLDAPVANVPVISYDLLQKYDQEATSQLFQAFKEYGFFLLNLDTSDEGRALLKDAEAMFDLTDETLDLDKDILNSFPVQLPKRVYGYKSTGKLATDDGFKDAIETFMFGQDDIMGDEEPQPQTVEARKSQCRSFCLGSHAATSVVLNCLDTSLDLPRGTLQSLCSFDKPSRTGLRMLRASPSSFQKDQTISAGAHTDVGVLTLVYNVVGGLQIRHVDEYDDVSNDDNWKYIRPRQGCVVVNVGDTLVQWTGGVLRSNWHRIHLPPGDQANCTRISLAYPLRPAIESSMQRLDGSRVIPRLSAGEEVETRSSEEWAAWKAQQFIKGQFSLRHAERTAIPHLSRQVAV